MHDDGPPCGNCRVVIYSAADHLISPLPGAILSEMAIFRQLLCYRWGPYRFGHGILVTTRRDSPRISAVPDHRVLKCLLCHGSICGIWVSIDEGFQGQAGNVNTVLPNGIHSSVEHHLIWLPKANFDDWRACRQAAKQCRSGSRYISCGAYHVSSRADAPAWHGVALWLRGGAFLSRG